MISKLILAAAAAAAISAATPANASPPVTCGKTGCSDWSQDARQKPARTARARNWRGPCDGFHRCRCGVTAARRAGLPLNYNGHNLKRAVEFKRALPRAAGPAVGVIVYQVGGGPSGHVSTIVHYPGSGCMATVYDDAGTYVRNICIRRAVYLRAPVGGSASAGSSPPGG